MKEREGKGEVERGVGGKVFGGEGRGERDWIGGLRCWAVLC